MEGGCAGVEGDEGCERGGGGGEAAGGEEVGVERQEEARGGRARMGEDSTERDAQRSHFFRLRRHRRGRVLVRGSLRGNSSEVLKFDESLRRQPAPPRSVSWIGILGHSNTNITDEQYHNIR